jgi:hypothetical protein
MGESCDGIPIGSWTVGGHTDAIGGDAPNFDLSKRRAAAVPSMCISVLNELQIRRLLCQTLVRFSGSCY